MTETTKDPPLEEERDRNPGNIVIATDWHDHLSMAFTIKGHTQPMLLRQMDGIEAIDIPASDVLLPLTRRDSALLGQAI